MPEDKWTKVGHTLAKGLGIKLAYRDPLGSNQGHLTRGESTFSAGTAEAYLEPEPTSIEWIKGHVPTGQQAMQYFIDILPFLKWIDRYNLQWLIGDLIAGRYSNPRCIMRKTCR